MQKKIISDTGVQQISHRNLRMLYKYFSKELVVEYSIGLQSRTHSLKNALGRRMEGLDKSIIADIIALIKHYNIGVVFLDTSLYGLLTSIIKEKFQEIKIITFFHNVERHYFAQLLKISRKPQHLITYKNAAFNERLACKYSDYLITLNDRDSKLLLATYKRAADLILPTSLNDNFDISRVQETELSTPLNILFVGSRFFANEEGVTWFIKNVCPFLKNVQFYVVGKGFETLKLKDKPANAIIVGFVEELEYFYYNADLVVSPIFSGGGMKTKTAEALMYGKTIVGTTEAFEGYDIDPDKVGSICTSRDEFINFINSYQRTIKKFNIQSREYYIKKFSSNVIETTFNEFARVNL